MEIQGPMTRRKEYQIMQTTLNKFQDSNNPDNSLLKKFDDFYKDNKNIENEVYFYRKPRVDKTYYQAEIKEENVITKIKKNYFDFKKNLTTKEYNNDILNREENKKINYENSNACENSNENYFDNNTENCDDNKEKIYYEENENKNIKISKYQKPELNDYSMPIIDLEDSNIRMEIEEYPKSFSLEKKRKENSEFQSENIDEKQKEKEILKQLKSEYYNNHFTNNHREYNYKNHKNICIKKFDYSKINKEDINYYLKFVEFYKNSHDFGNILLKGSQDFELLALDLLRDSNYSISLALKQILYPVVDYLEEDDSEKEFDVPYNYYNSIDYNRNFYNDNFSKINRNPYNKNSLNNGFDSAPDLKNNSNFFNSFTNNNNPYYSNNSLLDNKNKQDVDLYVNSALNDLIGSNMHEKSQWYEHVKKCLKNKISSQELQDLIIIAKKMKIDIPDFVLEENEKSLNFSKKIRKQLNIIPNQNSKDTERNNLSELNKLLEESKQYKVKYEEFTLLEDVIKKANLWKLRAKEIDNECVNYKSLQNLYNEGKNLPVKLENFEVIKSRYLNAQQWQEKYTNLPKHSKTRNQNFSQERCKITYLYSLVEEAEKINFTSNEVISLKTNYEKLREYEEKIFLSFEDDLLVKINKDILQEFINMLDTLKFTTETYDFIHSKISLFNWQENKEYYLSSKTLKMKHLRNLLKDANQKNLNCLLEIKNFAKQVSEIDDWLENISNIFYKDVKPETEKIDLKLLLMYFEQGKNFEIKPEEIEHLLIKCEEVVNFVKECEEVIEEKGKVFDFNHLLELREKIEKLNIKCQTFDKIENRISSVFEWIENYNHFKKKIENNLSNNTSDYAMYSTGINNNPNYSKNSNNISKNNNGNNNNIMFFGCNLKDLFDKYNYENEIEKPNLEKRIKMIDILEDYLKKNNCFYEHLNQIIENAPKYVKSGTEFNDLIKLKNDSEKFMSEYSNFISEKKNDSEFEINTNNLDTEMKNQNNEIIISNEAKIDICRKFSMEEIENIIINSQNFCVKSDFIKSLIILFKSESWSQIAITDKKMNLSDAEAMLKEGNTLSLEKEKLDLIKSQIQITREWIKTYKKFLNGDNFDYEKIKNILEEGENLPLISEEIKDLEDFLKTLNSDIDKAVFYIKNKNYDFEEFKRFVDKINQYAVFIPEFKIIEAMKEFSVEWKNIANKILQCRKLCTLFFKPRQDFSKFNNNESLFLNPNELINNNNENIPNNFDIYNEDLISNKNKSSSISVSRKKRNRADSYNNDNSNNFNLILNSNIVNSNKDSVSIYSEDIKGNLKSSTKNKHKKRKIEEKHIESINNVNSNTDYNNENFDNDFSKVSENLSSSKNKNKKKNKNLLESNENLIFNNNTNKKKSKNNFSSMNNSLNCFEQPEFNSQNFSNKKMKKAEKMQYENVLSVINSMPIKDKSNYGVSNSKNSYRKSQYKGNNDNYTLSLNDKTNDESFLNQDDSKSMFNGSITNQNQYDCLNFSNFTNNNVIPSSKKATPIMENISAKKFQTLSYQDQLNLVSCSFDLKEENPNEKYCICRRGDDSLNFMIMCEICKEWFHGICLHITKQASSKIASYLCLSCSKRKEISTAAYHGEFLNNKRVEYSKFLEFLSEYEYVLPKIPEYDLLIGIKEKMENWMLEYNKTLNEVFEFSKGNLMILIQQIENIGINENNSNVKSYNDSENIEKPEKKLSNNEKNKDKVNLHNENDNNSNNLNENENYYLYNNQSSSYINKIKHFLLNDSLEKTLVDLYLESEGFPVDNLVSSNLILILKFQDWFKDAYKCFEAKKYSEKLNKRVLTNYKTIFEMSQKYVESEEEKQLFNLVFVVAESIHSKIYQKNMELMNSIDQKINKEKIEIINQLDLLFEKNENLKNYDENQKNEFIKNQLSIYFRLKNNMQSILNENLNLESFKDIYEKMRNLFFKTGFTEKLKSIYKHFDPNRYDHYMIFLFEDDDKKIKNKEKTEKIEKRSRRNLINNNNKNNNNLEKNNSDSNLINNSYSKLSSNENNQNEKNLGEDLINSNSNKIEKEIDENKMIIDDNITNFDKEKNKDLGVKESEINPTDDNKSFIYEKDIQ